MYHRLTCTTANANEISANTPFTPIMCVSPGVVCEAELSFTLEPSDIIAVQEQPLMLHCQVNGIPPVSLQWRHNGLLVTQDQHRATFINGSLLIAHFLKTRSDGSSDEGDYECVAQNSFGLVVSRRARIQAASKSGLLSSRVRC